MLQFNGKFSDEITGISIKMIFRWMAAVCSMLALSCNCDVHEPNPSAPQAHSSLNASDVTPPYVTDDVTFPPPRTAGTMRWKTGGKGHVHGRGGGGGGGRGYLRMRSKYRTIGDQDDSSEDRFSNEYWIKRLILSTYDRNTLPARTDASTIPLHVGMSLYHILDTV